MKKFLGEKVSKSVVAVGLSAALVSGCEKGGAPSDNILHEDKSSVDSKLYENVPVNMDPEYWCGYIALREAMKEIIKEDEQRVEEIKVGYEKLEFAEKEAEVNAKKDDIYYSEVSPEQKIADRTKLEIGSFVNKENGSGVTIEETPIGYLYTVQGFFDPLEDKDADVEFKNSEIRGTVSIQTKSEGTEFDETTDIEEYTPFGALDNVTYRDRVTIDNAVIWNNVKLEEGVFLTPSQIAEQAQASKGAIFNENPANNDYTVCEAAEKLLKVIK